MSWMRRFFFNLTAWGSIALCALLLLFWGTSYVIRNEFYWGNFHPPGLDGRRSAEIEFNYGKVSFGWFGPGHSTGFYWDRFHPNSTPGAGWDYCSQQLRR